MSNEPEDKDLTDFLKSVFSDKSLSDSTPEPKMVQSDSFPQAEVIQRITPIIPRTDKEFRDAVSDMNNDLNDLAVANGMLLTAFSFMDSGLEQLGEVKIPAAAMADLTSAKELVDKAMEIIKKLKTVEVTIIPLDTVSEQIRLKNIISSGKDDLLKEFLEERKDDDKLS